jgi:uncharacterized protein (TIGR02594 family)
MARTGNALKSLGAQRAGMAQLSFQIGDVTQQMALGVPASRIFIQQSGQIIQAFQVMGVAGKGFLGFLAGPWGIALTTAGVILATLAGKLFENRDEVGKLVDKMREQARQADLNRQADEAWKKTIEGVTEAIRKRREEQQKSLQTDIQAEQKALEDARGELETQKKNLRDLQQRTLPAAERELDSAKASYAQVAGTNVSDPARVNLINAQRKVDDLKRQIKELVEKTIPEAEANIRGAEVPIAERSVEARIDKVKAATDAYTKTLGDLRAQLRGGAIDQAKFEAELEKAARKRDAAIKAAQEENRGNGGEAIFGEQIGRYYDTAAQFRGRSENNAVDRGVLEQFFREANLNLDPEKVKWCAAFVNAVLGANGVTGTGSLAARSFLNFGRDDTHSPQKGDIVVVSRKGQDHVGFLESVDKKGNVRILGGNTADKVGTSTYSKGEVLAVRRPPTPAETADLAQKAADRRQDQDDNFLQAKTRLDDLELQAQAELVQGIEAQADFAEKQIDAEQARYEASLQNQVNDNRLRQEQADLLIEKSRAIATQRKSNIETRKELELQEAQTRLENQAKGFDIDRLRYADQIAKTSAEHRQLQLEIIDILYKQKEADLRIALAKAEAAKNYEQVAEISAQLANLPAERARDRDAATRGTMNPLEKWADGVPQTAAQINEALMSIEANGLDALADGIAGVISGTQSLGDAFRSIASSIIADIARMIVRMLVMRALMSAFGGSFGGVGGAGAGAGEAAFNFGASGGYDAVNAGLVGMASGGILPIGGNAGIDTNVLSINGVPRARVSSNEHLAVIPAMPSAGIPKPANSNSRRDGDTFHIHVTAPNTGDPAQDRRSALQQASMVRREVTRAAQVNR